METTTAATAYRVHLTGRHLTRDIAVEAFDRPQAIAAAKAMFGADHRHDGGLIKVTAVHIIDPPRPAYPCSLCPDLIEDHHQVDQGGNNHLSCRRELDGEMQSARDFLRANGER